MTDPAPWRAAGQAAVPKPPAVRPKPWARPQPAVTGPQPAESRRAASRSALESVLTGVRLGCRDRHFLSKLVHWDKRNADSVASLLWRARQAGRDEAALTPRQLETVMTALVDAAVYRRTWGACALSCWDCDNFPGGRCADHARDDDRARTYADLAMLLSGNADGQQIPQPTEISGYRRRTPVAS